MLVKKKSCPVMDSSFSWYKSKFLIFDQYFIILITIVVLMGSMLLLHRYHSIVQSS